MSKKFPAVNYIGNKQKIADWIVEMIPINEGTVLDLFSGGGAVSYKFKQKGFKVLTNDSLYSSYVVNKALIENNGTLLDFIHIQNAIEGKLDLNLRNKLEPLSEGLYFPIEVDELTKFVKYAETLQGYEKYLFLSLLRRAMIRKLPYSRMNLNWENIKKLRDEDYSYRKYGRRRAYHNESFFNHMSKNLQSYNDAVFSNSKKNKAYHLDGLELMKRIPANEVDVIYIDPPYPGTMNNYEGFYGKFDKIFDKEISYRDITKPDEFISYIQEILEEASQKVKYIAFSLNSNSKPDISEIEMIAKIHGKTTIVEKKHNYQISGKINKNKNYEQLLIVNF